MHLQSFSAVFWMYASQVIQSYALSSICPYGFIFLIAHFIWAFSLMFLFSGRAYWQELIESILWSHHKLKIIPHIQPRALSIYQGRAVVSFIINLFYHNFGHKIVPEGLKGPEGSRSKEKKS